jgi:Domain of unknown function (DUF4260)
MASEKVRLSGPKILLHLEGLVVLVAACVLYREFGASWIKFAVFFLAPDLFMLGYVFGKKTGALFYNSVHTYIGPFLLGSAGYLANQPALFPFCAIWTAHIGFDRLLGYGLKYESDFKDTHLHRV